MRGARRLTSLGAAIVRALPRRAASRLAGALAERVVPPSVLRAVLARYSKHFGVDLSEAARPLSGYRTFNDFFTRELRAGTRPLDDDPAAIVSPVDGRVHASGRIEGGTVLQAKGVPYTVAELLGDVADAAPFDGGKFATLYLSPKDYHRIHWPFDATVTRLRHLPGDLWPVNDEAVASIRGLFARNERVAILGTTATGPFAMVPVGAFNVGSIRLAFHPLRGNAPRYRGPRTVTLSPPVLARRGGEAARFAFGSAVVLLVSAASGTLVPLEPRSDVRVGRRIGTSAPAPAASA